MPGRWCLTLIIALISTSCSSPGSEGISAQAVRSAASNSPGVWAAETARIAHGPPAPDELTLAASRRAHGDGPLRVHSPELISDHTKERSLNDAYYGRVVVGWGGRVTVVWYRMGSRGVTNGRLWASQRGRHGVWSKAQAVSDSFSLNGQYFDVAAGRGSLVSVVWGSSWSGDRQVHETHLQEGVWSAPTVIGRGVGPRVAVDGQGEISVLWFEQGANIASRTPDGSWAVQHFPGPKDAARGQDIAADLAGNEVAIWSSASDGLHAGASYRPAGSATWSPQEPVPTTTFGVYGPGLVFTGGGDVLAAWDASGISSVRRDASTGTWLLGEQVGSDPGDNENHSVPLASDDNGHALAIWVYDSIRWTDAHEFGQPKELEGGAYGGPMLTTAATAVVAQLQPGRVAFRWQQLGGPWSAAKSLDKVFGVWSTDARGRRVGILYNNARGLQLILITERR